MRKAFSGMTFAIAALSLGTPALAWWDAGHMQIAALAYDQLDPAVRDKVDNLIELNSSYPAWTAGVAEADKAKAAFVHAATWADEIKRDPAYTRDTADASTASQNLGYADRLVHDYWHYIDLPFSTDETQVAPPVSPNALTQVQLFMATLGSDASGDLKSYDLVWLLHLVGDLHQPLHATARFSQPLGDDRGGNDETVQPTQGQPVRLHLYWDSLLGDAATPSASIAAAQGLPAADTDAAAVSDPAQWIIESFAMAQNDVYTDLIGLGAGPFPLTQAYEDRALVVARERAALAGGRLASLINVALK